MKLFQLEKQIQQTLTDSKGIIQKGRTRPEVAEPDQRAAKQMRPGRFTNQIHPGCAGVTFLGTDNSLLKINLPCWKYICSRAIVLLSQSQSAERLTRWASGHIIYVARPLKLIF